MKKSYYFSHDFNARTDPKLIRLLMKHGLAGIGLFWCIIEMIHEQNGYLHKDECERIAFEMRTHSELVASVLNDFDLFCFDGESYYSKSALERINLKEQKSQKARNSAENRWKNANALRTQCEGNALNEMKGKEKKVNEIDIKKEINKEKKPKQRSAMSTIPEGYEISVQVRQWANENGITRLEERLAHFKDWATAGEKKYKDWDAAFRNALRGDWAKLNATPAKHQQFVNSEQPPTKQEIFKFAISQKDPLYKVNLDIFCSHYEKNGWAGDWKQNLARWFARIMENENNPARRFLTKYETETVISFSEYQGPGVGQKPLPEIYGIKLPIAKKED